MLRPRQCVSLNRLSSILPNVACFEHCQKPKFESEGIGRIEQTTWKHLAGKMSNEICTFKRTHCRRMVAYYTTQHIPILPFVPSQTITSVIFVFRVLKHFENVWQISNSAPLNCRPFFYSFGVRFIFFT